MEYNLLPGTDIKVSKICLGTMTWGRQNSEIEGHQQMDYALDKGVNFFDTAELYPIPPRFEEQGDTERFIGSWFKKNGTRKEVILASKIAGPATFTKHITLIFIKYIGLKDQQISLEKEDTIIKLKINGMKILKKF